MIDVAQSLSGLRAIQDEANKAVAALPRRTDAEVDALRGRTVSEQLDLDERMLAKQEQEAHELARKKEKAQERIDTAMSDFRARFGGVTCVKAMQGQKFLLSYGDITLVARRADTIPSALRKLASKLRQ